MAPQPGASFYVIGERTEGLAVGQLAPELSGMHDGQPITLDDLDGNPVSLAALRGRPVWVNLWASWCPPCQVETPVLRDVYRAHIADGLALIAVSVQEASPDEVRTYAETYDLPYTIAFDGTSDVFHAWHGYGSADALLHRCGGHHPGRPLRPPVRGRGRRAADDHHPGRSPAPSSTSVTPGSASLAPSAP